MARQNKWDSKHQKDLERYARQIDAIYQSAVREAAAIGATIPNFSPDTPFSFADYPSTRVRVQKLIDGLKNGVQTVILNGVDSEWTLANNKNDELCNVVFGDNVKNLSTEQERRYYRSNGKACDAFKTRKTAGLGLSDRVWNYTNQFKTEIEFGLDFGLRDGLSAAEMSRDLRQYLKYPDKLFRRVRDEHGQLHLSQAAKAFNPGQGVYRSSYKNAMRLARTETNMAYRTSDYTRWQQLDFVVGIEIRTSNNHPIADICDELAGRYPKDFKFTGWHPQCRCHAVSILKTPEEMTTDNERIMNGEELNGESVNRIDDVPQAFKDWVRDNEARVVKSNKLPYFITDNEHFVTKIMSQAQPSTRVADIMMNEHFKRYAPDMALQSGKIEALYERLSKSKVDAERAIIVNQIKNECAAVTHSNLLKVGCVGDDWVLARNKFDTIIQEAQTYFVNGKAIKLQEVKLDLLIYKDTLGREFVYPVGAASDMFKATLASDAIKELPPYISRGIKQVAFLDIPCPTDPYWRVAYKNPNHVSMAIDGGYTKFYLNPQTKEAFKEYMAHEAGHNIDKVGVWRFSNSKGWQEAVKKDDALYAAHLKGTHRVSSYALTNDQEDFAECIRAYSTDHEYFKNAYPNRAAYIRKIAQVLSGHFKTP